MRSKWFLGLIVVGLAVSVVLVAGCGKSTTTKNTTPKATTPKTTTSTGGTASVSIANFAFSPSTLTVSGGTKVTWTNNDSTAHTVTGSGWDSGQIQPGTTYSHTFDTAGTYSYHCSIHPSMTGAITVQSGSSSGTSGGTTTTPSGTTGTTGGY